MQHDVSHAESLLDDDCFFRALVDELPDMVCRYRPDSTLVYVNRAYAHFHGYTAGTMIGIRFLDTLPPDIRPVIAAKLSELVTQARMRPSSVNEHQAVDARGSTRWVEWTDQAVFALDGSLDGFVAVGRDVTARRQAEERAIHLANHDPLTDLPNRRRTLDRLAVVIDRLDLDCQEFDHCSDRYAVGVIFLDIDGFKAINDRVGHRAGDKVLCCAAEALRRAVREGDLLGRMGGDEFLIVAPGVPASTELERIIERVRYQLRQLEPPVRISAGAVLVRPGESVEEVVHRADQAMYLDKQLRKGEPASRVVREAVIESS